MFPDGEEVDRLTQELADERARLAEVSDRHRRFWSCFESRITEGLQVSLRGHRHAAGATQATAV